MNEVEMQQATARAEGSRIAYEWMRKNIRRFEPCEANSKLIGEWLEKNNLSLSDQNLDRAAEAIGDQLARAASVPATPAPPAEPTLNSVAPVPAYFPRLEIPSDIARIHHEKLKGLRQGPHGEGLKRRINALQQGYRNAPVAAAPQAVSTPVEDGLPPIPVGADASLWPSTVDQITQMSRDQFRLLFHSKRFGEAFRKRIEAIYARERGR